MIETYLKLIFSIVVSIYILRLTVRIAPDFYTLRFISGYYTLQFFAILFLLITLPDARIWNKDFPNLLIKSYINEVIFGYFLFQIGILIAVAVGSIVFRKIHKRSPFVEYIKTNHAFLGPVSSFVCFVILTHPFLIGIPVAEYASNILFNFLNFAPFIAGALFFNTPRLNWLWMISLSILFVLGILSGSRGTAVTAGALYAIGFYYALTTKRARRIAIIVATVVSIPLVSFLAFVGIFRHIVGRVDFDKITWERTVSMYKKYEKIKDSKVLNLDTEEGKIQGQGRFVNFVNILEFATIPSKRPFLGFDGLFTVDLPYAFDISFISGTTVEDRLRAKASGFRLNDYGYGITLTSSVEYSVVTDSYIRFGYLGVFVFAIIIASFCQILEFVLYLISRGLPDLRVLGTVMLCQQALMGYAYSPFIIMRSMIVSVMAAVAIIGILRFLKILFKNRINPKSNSISHLQI